MPTGNTDTTDNTITSTTLGLIERIAIQVTRAIGCAPAAAPRPDVAPADAAIIARCRPYTMTSDERLLALIDSVRYLSRSKIAGAVVECGVWKGGSSMAAALALLASGGSTRDLYLYDTFDGMNAPTDVDRSHDGIPAAEQLKAAPRGRLWCISGLDEVQGNMGSTNYPAERVHYVPGNVEDTIPRTVPGQIALLRLDTDWYESTRHELTHLFPRLVRGGVLIVDDYGHWEGARKATDEFLQDEPIPLFLSRIDYTGRIGIKL